MKSFKILFWITVISCIVVLTIGACLFYFDQTSSDYSAGLLGIIHFGTVTGPTCLFIGFLLFLLSFWTYNMYKEETRKFNKMK